MNILRNTRHRSVLLCALIVAVVVYGLTSTLVSLLGSNHTHRVVSNSDPMQGWQDFRRSNDSIRMTPLGHVHSHDGLARHHHAADDPTVVTLNGHSSHDGAGGDDASRLAGAAALVLAFVAIATMPLLPTGPQRWGGTLRLHVASRCVAPLDRPPKA